MGGTLEGKVSDRADNQGTSNSLDIKAIRGPDILRVVGDELVRCGRTRTSLVPYLTNAALLQPRGSLEFSLSRPNVQRICCLLLKVAFPRLLFFSLSFDRRPLVDLDGDGA